MDSPNARWVFKIDIVYHVITAALPNFLLGVCLGATGGLLGIGGGLIAIPVLGFLYGMDQHLAQGTALVMIAPNVLIGFLRYHQKSRIDLRSVASMSFFSMLAAYLSARFATDIDAAYLHVAFACFLIALAGYFGFQIRERRSSDVTQVQHVFPTAVPAKALPLLGLVSGGMSGIFTVGGGLVVVPALVSLFGISQTQAQGMALALVVPGALAALFTYAQAGHVDWAVGLPLASGGMMSISWGVALAHQISAVRLRIMFCSVLIATAVMMLLAR